jgi:hypothetical protein
MGGSKAPAAGGTAFLEAMRVCDKYRWGRGVHLHPKKRQKIQTDDWEWYVRPKEGKGIFPTIEFYHSVEKIPHLNGLLIYSL